MALAASLVLGLALGQFVPRGGAIGTPTARWWRAGPLAEALDTQLASAQAGRCGDPDRRQLRARRRQPVPDLRQRRTSGLACRESDNWRMIATAAAGAAQRSDFRQAGSDSPIILQAAQELMAGEPLDDAAERSARDSGWRGSARRP